MDSSALLTLFLIAALFSTSHRGREGEGDVDRVRVFLRQADALWIYPCSCKRSHTILPTVRDISAQAKLGLFRK